MRMLFILLFVQVCLLTHAQPKKAQANSTIQDVTVFASGARIERVSTVQLSPGRTVITFPGLSNQLDQQSVQLSANENITLLSVQAAKDFLTERQTEAQEQQLIDTITKLKSAIALDKKLFDVYKNEENMLIKNEAIGGQAGVKTSELKEALDLHRQRLTEVYKKQLEIENAIAAKENNLKALSEQLQEFSRKKDSVNYVVTALVESKTPANVKFQLSYNVKDAGWYPAYDIRVKNVIEPLEFLMNANVFQRSGETWKNVTLSLSTGNPNENNTPSQLQPWRLGFYNPYTNVRNAMQTGVVSGRVTNENGEPIAGASVMIKGTPKGTATDANGFFKLSEVPAGSVVQVSLIGYETKDVPLMPGYTSIVLVESSAKLEEVVVSAAGVALQGRVAGVDIRRDQAPKQEKAQQIVEVATQYQPTTLVYKIDDKYSIETDGKTTTIGIRSFEVPAGYIYNSIPKLDPSSFLTAQVVDWQDLELQPGEASMYFEGSFLGKTYIDLSEVGDTLSLSLGKDNGVKVSRRLLKEYSAKRFFGSNQTDKRQYEITLRNTKREAVEIIVQDQFPVSIIKDISVIDTSAPGANIAEDSGIVTWDVKLAPGEEKKLTIGYTVRYPKGRKVVLE